MCNPHFKIGVDLFELSHEHYLLSVNYYSKYPEVTLLSDTSLLSIVNALKENFATAHIIVSDNGPQLRATSTTCSLSNMTLSLHIPFRSTTEAMIRSNGLCKR